MLLHKTIFTFGVAAMCFACNSAHDKAAINSRIDAEDSTVKRKSDMLLFDNLVGTWKAEDGKSFERWIKNEDGSYHSVGFDVKGNDTTYTERISFYQEGGKWISENTVVGQNENEPVKFTATILTESSVHFSNPAHDFPTDVNYTLVNSNTLNAFIVGPNKDGGKDTIPFNFQRVLKTIPMPITK